MYYLTKNEFFIVQLSNKYEFNVHYNDLGNLFFKEEIIAGCQPSTPDHG